MMLAAMAATAAIVVSFAPVTTAEARCKPAQAGAQASSLSPADLDTTLTRLQQRYDCSRSMQANFDETLSSPGGDDAHSQGDRLFQESRADAMGVCRAVGGTRS